MKNKLGKTAGQETVRHRISRSNAWMVILTLLIFLAISLIFIKIYSELVEAQLKSALSQSVPEGEWGAFLAGWTVEKNSFLLLFAGCGLVCILLLTLLGRIFTGRLTDHIMEPLNALTEAAGRIRNNDFSQQICYRGDKEFEEVCGPVCHNSCQ